MNSAQAAQRSGATYRQIDYWTRLCLIRPAGGVGSGQSREWPEEEVDVLTRMVALVKWGLTPARAVEVARLKDGAMFEQFRTFGLLVEVRSST